MGQMPQGEDFEYLSPGIQYLRPHHRHIARLAAAGARPMEIATLTGFSAGQISRILGSPCFQAALGELEEKADEVATDLRQDLAMMAEQALANLDEDLQLEAGENLEVRKVRQKASMDILDRLGIRKTNPNVKELHLHKHDHDEIHIKEKSDEDIYADIQGFLGKKKG